MRLNELCLMAFQVEMRLKCNLKCKTFPYRPRRGADGQAAGEGVPDRGGRRQFHCATCAGCAAL